MISVVIPAYNEAETVGAVIFKVAMALPDIEKEIIVVDDGSTDGTRDWLERNVSSKDAVYRSLALDADGNLEVSNDSGNIAGVRMDDGLDPSAVVDFRMPLIDGRTAVEIDRQQIIDMVVAFCRDRAIPLPKSGRKMVVRRDDNVVLEIELDWF